MIKKVLVGDELATSLKVDGETFAPICIMLNGREITKEKVNTVQSAYAITRKEHPRLPEILSHVAAMLECIGEEPLSPLGRSIQYEDNGIDFHVMQVTLYSTVKPTFSSLLEGCFKPISIKSFRKLLGKE